MVRKVLLCMVFVILATGFSQVGKVLFSEARSVPKMLNYQGYLTDTLGIPIDDTLDMTFKIYDAATVGNELWNELQTNVPVERGVFSVLLGSATSIPDTVFTAGADSWLELTLEGPQTLSPRTRITAMGYAYTSTYADTAEYAKNAVADNDWVRGTPDSVLFTANYVGIARGGADNVLYGDSVHTHNNLGIACTTGTSAQDHYYCTVGGGQGNTASGSHATVGGGRNNSADSTYATVGGGYNNTASGYLTTMGGGTNNTASGQWATVGGGGINTASGGFATVGGGSENTASDGYATVGGGANNTASDGGATVSGGSDNTASDGYATVGGGYDNDASGHSATVGGGSSCKSDGACSFTVGSGSVVPSSYPYSAAFNGQTATATGQTRIGILSKASGTFTIDHPTEPMNKILNHYFVESPEMVLIYRGVAIIGSVGRAEVHLPDYFDVLNRNPTVQLTGVGTSDVYVAEKVTGNHFVIGGKPGTEVYWTVTAERKDQSAEITRILMPVEQLKEGDLAGHSLDDDFLATTMSQLERMGRAGTFKFRTAEGQEKYERSLRALEKTEPTERE